jgi:hypothetical protein
LIGIYVEEEQRENKLKPKDPAFDETLNVDVGG